VTEVKLVPKFVKKPPTYKTLAQTRTLESRKKEKGKALGGVYGFVDPHFEFIHNPRNDWKLASSSPRMWKFAGTALTLQVSPEVFLPGDYRKYPAVLRPIAAHEDLHVQDARTIVTKLLPAQLKKDNTFKKYFFERALVPDTTYSHMICQKMTGYVGDIFTKIWNGKANERDTPAKYRPVRQAVDAALHKSYR
jgi:hypothetical protein